MKKVHTKICYCCKKSKIIKEFNRDKNKKDGFACWCRYCASKNKKQYYLKNKEKVDSHSRQYALTHKEERKIYRLKNHKRTKIYNKKWNLENKEYKKKYCLKNKNRIKLQSKEYGFKNREKLNLYSKQYRFENKNKIKKYFLLNKEKFKKYRYIYWKRRLKTDIDYRILKNCRGRIRDALRSSSKSNHTIDLIMCSIPELKLHIEKHWQKGMSWKNYGFGKNKWHIDHIIPCSFFNMRDPVEQHMCFRRQNLQPLWQNDNFKKGNTL